jgi:hypothetical protein
VPYVKDWNTRRGRRIGYGAVFSYHFLADSPRKHYSKIIDVTFVSNRIQKPAYRAKAIAQCAQGTICVVKILDGAIFAENSDYARPQAPARIDLTFVVCVFGDKVGGLFETHSGLQVCVNDGARIFLRVSWEIPIAVKNLSFGEPPKMCDSIAGKIMCCRKPQSFNIFLIFWVHDFLLTLVLAYVMVKRKRVKGATPAAQPPSPHTFHKSHVFQTLLAKKRTVTHGTRLNKRLLCVTTHVRLVFVTAKSGSVYELSIQIAHFLLEPIHPAVEILRWMRERITSRCWNRAHVDQTTCKIECPFHWKIPPVNL